MLPNKRKPLSTLDQLIHKKVDQATRYIQHGEESEGMYINSFEASGKRKATSVIRQLDTFHLAQQIDFSKVIYVSVGGSSGHELEHALTNTDIKRGVLVEIDKKACELAESRLNNLSGATCKIVEGDVLANLDQMRRAIESLLTNEDDIVLFSINAVFHELPFRSKHEFVMNTFLAELTWDWRNCMIVTREPCNPFFFTWKNPT
jgi:16S rRNA G966 N2-methylase RsmD